MADITISKFTTQVLRQGSTPASPGFAVDEGQNPTDPSGNPPTHLPVTIAPAADGLSITDSQVLGGAGTTSQYLRGDGSLATFPALTGFVPYTGATADVNLGTHDLTAERGTFENNGSSDTLTVNHTSGSGIGVKVTKGGNNEALLVTKTSGSGNAMAVVGGRTSLVDLALSSVTNTAGDFLTISGGVVHKRTAAEVRTDIGAGTGNGTVTSVAALTLGTTGTDLTSTVANGTTTPVITLNVPTASAANRGALSAADWTTFNGKQDNIVAGTTAQYYRGDKTFQTLNTAAVPELTNLYYTEARVSANTDVAANTAARHNAVTLGTANGLSLSTQELSLGLASSSANGALSSTDWTTFNSKQNALTDPVTGTGSINVLPKFTGTSTIGNSQIIDDGTSVSIGGISENGFLNIAGLNQNLNIYCVTSVGPNWSANLFLKGGSLTSVQALYLGYGSNYYDVYIKRNVDGRLSLGTNQNDRLSIFNQGNVFIGSSVGISDNGTKLQVSGSASFTDLSGTGTRMVVANASGVLSTQAITVGTVTNVTASTPLFSSGGATPNITIQQASGSQNGFLSSTDWTTFNNKQNTITNPVTGTGTAGQVAYWSSGSAITGESNLFWDATNDRLGIGTATPAATLEINGDIRTAAPTGTSTINWKLGRALLATSSDPEDRWIRVQLGTKIYDILAIDRGDA